jgi:RNA polymerase sigma-70 factor (ECF subfamily)
MPPRQSMNETPKNAVGVTRPSLLVRLRDGTDGDAWRNFAALYTPLVYGYAIRRGLQHADAADVAQEVLMEVARCIRGFEYSPDKGKFRDWLGLVTRRRIGKLFRKTAVTTGPDADGIAAAASDTEWTTAFHAHVLEAALARIRPEFQEKTWEAFREHWLRDQPADVVASRNGMTLAALYIAKSRVLKRLREEALLIAEDIPTLNNH